MITLKSNIKLEGAGFNAEATSRGFKVQMDEPENFGGENTAMNPLELLLGALGGCLTISCKAFSKEAEVELKNVTVEIEGDFDPAGFMGKDPNVRKGFQDIRCKVNIESDSPKENVEKLLKIVKERCPVSDTLKGVNIDISS